MTLFSPADAIGSVCTLALLLEVSATPKPGLVDRLGNGAHNDMDFSTFLSSAAAIAPYFSACAKAGTELPALDGAALARIRPLGVQCDQVMLAAAKGANTHKGAIFSLGILACAAGFLHREGDLSPAAVCAAAAIIAAPALKDFDNPASNTKGLRLYAQQGVTGIRGEAASGFASARQWALPILEELSGKDFSENDVHLQALLLLMANVRDTNLLARGGEEGLAHVRSAAREALAHGGALSVDGKARLIAMDKDFTRRNLSPGGCADLLAVAIFLHRLPSLAGGGEGSLCR